MQRTIFGTATLSLLLSGCVNLAPEHRRPDLSVSDTYATQLRPDGSAVASEISWRDFFKDERLKSLIASALAGNRDLMAATARIEQARARYRIQDSRRLPDVVAQTAARRTRQPLTAATSGSAAVGSGGSGGSDAPASITYDRFDVGVGISAFELDFWGRIDNLSDAARAEYLATVSAQRAFYLTLIADVATTYYQLIETQEQIALANATAESRREGLRIARRRLDAGVTSALPYRQSETLLTQAEQQLAEQELAAARLRSELAVLVGGHIPDDLPEGRSLEDQDNGLVLDAGLPSDLMLSRPDVIAAEERLRAARADIGAARAAFFPSISLTGSAGVTSTDLDSLFSEDSLTWTFGPSLDLPIFDWGQREANLDLARAMEVEEVANYDLTVQNAFREVSDALAGRVWLNEEVRSLERAVIAQERIARIARLRYNEGVANYLEVLDAERNLFSARQSLLATRRAFYQNKVALFTSLGGGFDDRYRNEP